MKLTRLCTLLALAAALALPAHGVGAAAPPRVVCRAVIKSLPGCPYPAPKPPPQTKGGTPLCGIRACALRRAIS